MVIRVSLLAAASVAALTVKHKKASPFSKKNADIRSPDKGSHGLYSEDEFREREESNADAIHTRVEGETETAMKRNPAEGDTQKFELLISCDKLGNVTETELLQNSVRRYKQSQAILERKLIELKDLKEEQSDIAHLRRQIDEMTKKLDLLNTTMASLQGERKVLGEKIRKGVLVEKELDMV